MPTIISFLPYASEESKPSVIPPVFAIPASKDLESPVFLPVTNVEGIEYIPLKGGRKYPISAQEYGQAIVRDKINSALGRDVEKGISPAIHYVEKNINTVEQLKKEYPGLFERLQNQQKQWYKALVMLADDDWQKFKQHRMISDLQRFACRALGLDRDWAFPIEELVNSKCPACMTDIHPKAIVCGNCNAVLNKDEFKKYQMT